jgi:hypothetical protein
VPGNRRHFLELVGQMIQRQAVQVHAYVLMDKPRVDV